MVGAVGGPAGTTALEAAEGADWLTALMATTLNVYEVPLVSAEIVQVSAVVVVHVFESGVEVTV